MIYRFDSQEELTTSAIGGKAKALVDMTKAGFNVPEGIVLSLGFFKHWLDEVKRSEAFNNAIVDTTKENCELVAELANGLVFTQEQGDILGYQLEQIKGDVFAVRSSSPEEDLQGLSFAGMYETFLGVKKMNLENMIIKTFASCFDNRVLSYKKENGLDIRNVSIAVIIQKQVDSEFSGVGFSVNPMTNDHDEIMINSSYGLGEVLVSGLVTPDSYIVNKQDFIIINQVKGKHEVTDRLSEGGGTKRSTIDHDDYSLGNKEVKIIAEAIVDIESYYGFPVDIEWAIKDSILFILQARPITTHIPIEPHMMTRPDEKRMLYMDANLVDAMTNNVPIYPLTIDWFYGAFMMFLGPVFADVEMDGHLPPKEGLIFNGAGRVYINLSHMLHLTKLEKVMDVGADADQQLGEIAKNIDQKIYEMDQPLFYLKKWFLLRKSPKWLWNSRKLFSMIFRAYYSPNKFYEQFYEPNVSRVIKKLKSDDYIDVPLTDLRKTIDADMNNALFYYCWSAIVPLMIALKKVPELVKDGSSEMDELADAIFMGTNGNESIELGISLYHMAKMLVKSDFNDLDQLASRIEQRELSEEFLKLWDTFINVYKYRGPNELELSNHRYGDDYKIALQQMSYMVDSEHNPEEAQRLSILKREDAYKRICQKLKGRKLKAFKKQYRIAILYSTVRDKPKYIWLLENGIYRTRALLEGQRLVDQKILAEKEDIFYVYFDELDRANNSGDIDLKSIVRQRKSYYDSLKRVHSYPLMMDSRGRIMTAKPTESDNNTIVGHGISRGIRKGKIKVLRFADEKPIEKGDVLVTYTTDPGWTPLFVNAEAIILQVGGPLQHGGVVAREYGKPCVAGVTGVYEVFKDGQMVEVDGTNGRISFLD